MVDELKEILTREGITTAAIIDDVFDETPTSKSINEESWNFFLDDQSEKELAIIREGYGVSDPEARWDELRNDDNFIQFLWQQKDRTAVLTALFKSFSDGQAAGRSSLEPLRVLLFDQLNLQGRTFGSQEAEAGLGAQLLFVDLFLGAQQDEDAKEKALARVKGIVDTRRESPPIIVLISSSLRLQTMRDAFRDEAGLFGCQFRTVQKSELSEPARVHELIYRICSSYRDTTKLSSFIELWDQALREARDRFVKATRRLDLRDYADLQNLILNAEGELIGAYLFEVFGQYFLFQLEEDARLSSSALRLNEMHWDNYPAPHFLPASISGNIADGLLFRSSKILVKSESLQFGDVLFSTRVDALGEGTDPAADFAKGERIALLVLTAACDLQHGNAKTTLFMVGVAKQSELVLHKKPKALVTPVLIHDGKHYTIEWEVGAPIAWTPRELQKQLDSGAFERVRRFRSLFSLQLQQLFTSSLSRVGTPVMPPIQQLTGITISYVDIDRTLVRLASAESTEQQAVVLVGRNELKYLDRVMLSPELVSDVRVAMQKLDINKLLEKDRSKWQGVIQKRELFSKMEEGIPFERNSFQRSFNETEYDIVSVIGPYAEKERAISLDRKAKGDHGPLIIELEISLEKGISSIS